MSCQEILKTNARNFLALLASFCFSFSTVTLCAEVVQPTEAALTELDHRIEKFLVENNVPGTVVAVASQGKILYLKPYGLANVELLVPVTEQTVFEIGSISKQFTAAAALLLVEENKLDLDDPIHKYLKNLPSEWFGVTVRQLLTHTSGIPDYEEIRSYDVYRFRLTPQEIIQIAHSRPVDFAAGTGWNYSNTGYFLLSRILETIEGRPLGQILQTRIFSPLGMTQTRMADPEAIIPHRAAGYWVNKKDELINRKPTETSSTLGAGGLLSTAQDLAKWDASLYTDQILSAKSKQAMWTPVTLPEGESHPYGFGWDLRPYQGLKSQSHLGQVAGFGASFTRFPKEKVAFIIFTNRYRVRRDEVMEVLTSTFLSNLRQQTSE